MRFQEIKENLENIKEIKNFSFISGHKKVEIEHLGDIDVVNIIVTSAMGASAKSSGVGPEIESEVCGEKHDYMTIEFFSANSLTYQVHKLQLNQNKQ